MNLVKSTSLFLATIHVANAREGGKLRGVTAALELEESSSKQGFNYETAPVCSETSYDPQEKDRSDPLNPAFDYVPFYDMYANEDCKDYTETDSVQCGLENYGESSINWAFGPDHGTAPGAFKGANWKTMGEVGKSSTYANDGLMVGVITWTEPGAVRDPHWHNNAAEFGYLLSGEVRITVVGLPKTDLAYDASSKTIDHSERSSETFILHPGDAFYSPVGYHHYIENLSEESKLFAFFDTEDLQTFDTPQVLKSLPPALLSQVLDVQESEAEDWYKGSRRVLTDPQEDWDAGDLPDTVDDLLFKVPSLNKDLTQAPREELNGQVFTKAINAITHEPLSKSRFSFAYTEISPGATLEPYWTDDADEIVYVLEGEDLEVVRSANGKRECKDVFTIEEGYLALNEIGSTWAVTNNSKDKTAKLLRAFNVNDPSVSTLYDAFHTMPDSVVSTSLRPDYFDSDEAYAMLM